MDNFSKKLPREPLDRLGRTASLRITKVRFKIFNYNEFRSLIRGTKLSNYKHSQIGFSLLSICADELKLTARSMAECAVRLCGKEIKASGDRRRMMSQEI